MTLRYATLASPTLRAGYDEAMGKVRRFLPMAPTGRPIVPERVAWIASEFLKTRPCDRLLLASPGGRELSRRERLRGVRQLRLDPEFVPALRSQLADIRELQADARRRGWTSEVERHGRVIESLEAHLAGLENEPDSEGVLDTPPMAG